MAQTQKERLATERERQRENRRQQRQAVLDKQRQIRDDIEARIKPYRNNPFRNPNIRKLLKEEILELSVPTGAMRGQEMFLMPWQKRFVNMFCDWRQKDYAVSMARGNAKTTTMGAILRSALEGHLAVPGAEIRIVAANEKQGKKLFNALRGFIGKERLEDTDFWKVRETPVPTVIYLPIETNLQIVASNAEGAHGDDPALVVCDEPAKWKGREGGIELKNALYTALGKQSYAKFIQIGTLPADPAHWYRQEFVRKTVKSLCYTILDNPLADPPKDLKPYLRRTIYKANPSIKFMPDLMVVLQSEIAKIKDGDAELERAWMTYRLNAGTEETREVKHIVDLENWLAILRTPDQMPPAEGPVFIGIDMGGAQSMTCIVFYWPETGRLRCYGAFGALPKLKDREKEDGVPNIYNRMFKSGELMLYPGRTVPANQFINDILKRLPPKQHIELVVADRYKKGEVEDALDKSKLRNMMVHVEFRGVGKGEHGMRDIVDFQTEVLSGHLNCQDQALMTLAVRNTVVDYNPNGNYFDLKKIRARDRIDPLQAAVLAVGAGRRWRETPEDESDMEDWVG